MGREILDFKRNDWRGAGQVNQIIRKQISKILKRLKIFEKSSKSSKNVTCSKSKIEISEQCEKSIQN